MLTIFLFSKFLNTFLTSSDRMLVKKSPTMNKKNSEGVWIFLLVSDTLFNINQRWKLAPIFVEVVEQYIFFSVTGDISGPFRQIWNLECLQFRVETELLYDLKVGCMCLNNLSGYTSDYSVFYNWKKNTCLMVNRSQNLCHLLYCFGPRLGLNPLQFGIWKR